MFSTNTHDYVHIARHKELEAEAQKYCLYTKLPKKNAGSILRKRIGTSLIVLGKKLVKEADAQLIFSSAQR